MLFRSALAKAEASWKAEEAARLASAEARWQAKSANAAADMRAQAESMRASGVEFELNRLREELAAMQAALMDRETALARADLAIERTRARG